MDLSKMDLSLIPAEYKAELLDLLEKREEYRRYNKLEYFRPYDFQMKFYESSAKYKRRFLCAANRVGKSFSEAAEVAWHLTGLYPEWWKGHRFNKPLLLWCVGITGDSTRKVLQKELFGTITAKDKAAIGTGAIPRKYIDLDMLERDGERILTAKIKHFGTNGVHDGWSICEFRSTQQGEHVLMGATVDYIWLDEEDPFKSTEIFSQCVTRTATTGGIVTITATPENGLTKLVDLFMKNDKGMLYFQNATWDDAPHLTEDVKKELLASIPEWQHEMRSRGIPMMGEGLIYDVAESDIAIDPFELPSHWQRVCAVDIGIAHDTAAVWSAYDATTDTIYIYDAYHAKAGVPAMHATAINARGNWIPVVLPHDADNTERGSGRSVAQYYREAGVNVLMETFYNPIDWDGKKHNLVEPGLIEMTQRMKTGRLKVFKTCGRFFEEMRRYHRKDGRIVKTFDDTMDAARYSALSVKGRGISAGEGAAGYNASYNDMWSDNFNVNY
ncbi:MAG: terminase large subunit domain-containing protein [Aeromonas popoffii]|uniref:terminase large subunit domain-containing protein n=1 Tax=Aeromonas popoffii TaxID=70856 RepID=UPI003F404A5C